MRKLVKNTYLMKIFHIIVLVKFVKKTSLLGKDLKRTTLPCFTVGGGEWNYKAGAGGFSSSF